MNPAINCSIFLIVGIYFFILHFFTLFFLANMHECPICYTNTVSIFENSCSHVWCKKCHNKMIQIKHHTCPLCREEILLKKRPTHNTYIEWLLNGGQPVYRWRTKRYRKRYKQYLTYKYH